VATVALRVGQTTGQAALILFSPLLPPLVAVVVDLLEQM